MVGEHGWGIKNVIVIFFLKITKFYNITSTDNYVFY